MVPRCVKRKRETKQSGVLVYVNLCHVIDRPDTAAKPRSRSQRFGEPHLRVLYRIDQQTIVREQCGDGRGKSAPRAMGMRS